MLDVAENIDILKSQIPENVKLVAISKTKPAELILRAYHSGHKIFGENKVQELAQKYEKLPKDIEWHMVGHLQTNKVKYIAPFVNLIHSIDSLKLLKVVNKEAQKSNRIVDCLLQIHIADEETKFGLSKLEVIDILNSEEYLNCKNIQIIGLMGMATYTNDIEHIRREFRYLKSVFDELKTQFFSDNGFFKEISMGMSGDYETAIEEGSTMVRIGSSIFGNRIYSNK